MMKCDNGEGGVKNRPKFSSVIYGKPFMLLPRWPPIIDDSNRK